MSRCAEAQSPFRSTSEAVAIWEQCTAGAYRRYPPKWWMNLVNIGGLMRTLLNSERSAIKLIYQKHGWERSSWISPRSTWAQLGQGPRSEQFGPQHVWPTKMWRGLRHQTVNAHWPGNRWGEREQGDNRWIRDECSVGVLVHSPTDASASSRGRFFISFCWRLCQSPAISAYFRRWLF